jgi:hypothetical protein
VRATPANDASDEVRAEAGRLWAAPVDVSAAVLAAQGGDEDAFRVVYHRQRRRPGPSVPIEQLTDRPGDEDTAGSALDALGTDTALALIARLPRDQAEAVLLRVLVGPDAKAAGRVLGRRPGAVPTAAAYRGLRRLATFPRIARRVRFVRAWRGREQRRRYRGEGRDG